MRPGKEPAWVTVQHSGSRSPHREPEAWALNRGELWRIEEESWGCSAENWSAWMYPKTAWSQVKNLPEEWEGTVPSAHKGLGIVVPPASHKELIIHKAQDRVLLEFSLQTCGIINPRRNTTEIPLTIPEAKPERPVYIRVMSIHLRSERSKMCENILHQQGTTHSIWHPLKECWAYKVRKRNSKWGELTRNQSRD